MMKRCILSLMVCAPIGAFAMADRTPPVYGRPTLYGEYELTRDDVARAAGMYGDVPHAVVVAGPAQDKVAKQPVKSKKAAARKSAKKHAKKTAGARAAKSKPKVVIKEEKKAEEVQIAPMPAVEPFAPVVQAEPQTNIPDEYAASIKGALANKYDVASYCVPRDIKITGKLPDGYILMPGRPDLMSCTGK